MEHVNLSERQREILRRVVEDYVATGQPVGSKTLVERAAMSVSPSTVRNELQELEQWGLLTHPHTSAGRVPTEAGYRFYVDELLERLDPGPATFPLDLSQARSEIEEALQSTTEMLSEVTRLLALVSAPPLQTSTIRHVEVLLLQPQVVAVVVITSTGGVTKRRFAFSEAIDPGLANWAREYLNDALAGMQLGTRAARRPFEDPGLSSRERSFLAALQVAFTETAGEEEQRVFVGGAATLLGDARPDEVEAVYRLLGALERRAHILDVLGRALDSRRPFVKVGVDQPGLADVALVGASYGLAHRTLGAVTLLGPLRMDYEHAIRNVRGAAAELSRFIEDVYEES